MKSEITFRNIIAYLQGNLRYFLYYNKYFSFLMRSRIREQIDFRIAVMDKECYANGSCKLCGCKTTALQMANKMCDKPCYPPMLDKKDWKNFKIGLSFYIKKKGMKYMDKNTIKIWNTY